MRQACVWYCKTPYPTRKLQDTPAAQRLEHLEVKCLLKYCKKVFSLSSKQEVLGLSEGL